MVNTRRMAEAHQLAHILDCDDSRIFRVTDTCGDVFRLKEFEAVDASIYNDATARWCARVEEPVSSSHPDFKRRYRPKSLLQLRECDIAQVIDELSDTVLYARDHGTPTI